jgi:endonuclease/exonuclease/phosphatase family metal-dependent hydrolase
MSFWRLAGVVGVAMIVMAAGALTPSSLDPGISIPGTKVAGDLTVMTYNIKAQPWPLASNRAAAIDAIGDRLARMRNAGRQPNIVLLQEAFTAQSHTLAERAGYRYLATGPTQDSAGPAAPLGKAFAAAASWDRGEESAPVFDSGLLVLSDYPILRVRRIGFPAGACAGFDCLASKGVLIAWVKVPGSKQPVAVVNTHLNSRESTYVDLKRADRAQAWQVADLSAVVAREVDPKTPAIFGGDTNMGSVPLRVAAFRDHPPLGSGERNTLRRALADGHVDAGSLHEADGLEARNKDLILVRDGSALSFATAGATVPFPSLTSKALSDHAGWMAGLTLSPLTQPRHRLT